MRAAFEAYIARSLTEEMDRVAAYYGERGGGFWVALRERKSSACSALNLQRLMPWSCVACMSTRPPDVAGSPGRCCNLQKLNAVGLTCDDLN